MFFKFNVSSKPKRPFLEGLSFLLLVSLTITSVHGGGAWGSDWSGVTSVTGDSSLKSAPSDLPKGGESSSQAGSTSSSSTSSTSAPGAENKTDAPAETQSETSSNNSSHDNSGQEKSSAAPVWDGSGANPSTPVVKPALPAKAPQGDGRPQIALQMPPPKQLAYMLRMNEPAARARIKIATERCRQHLAKAGMDASIDVDDAMELSKPVINIYLKKSVGDNILAHGFCMQAFLMQYQRKPSGRVETVRCARIGESPEIYSGADWEDKVVTLVDAYISARHHQLKEAAKSKPLNAKGKPGAATGKKK